MNAIIDAAFSRSRVVVIALLIVLGVGALSYSTIPKEANPEVPLPLVYVSTGLDGISPTDAERLLLEPMEAEFGAIADLQKMSSDAAEGFASVQLEFTAGGDIDDALDKVREAADRVEGELPDDAYDLTITEINTALFPIITVVLSGPVPERTLNGLADDAQEAIEGLAGVLEVDIGGARDEFLEVLIDPTVFQTYGLSFDEVVAQVQRNNRLIAAGAIETGGGRIVLKVPGLIEGVEDVMALPIKVRGDAVVTFGDVAEVRRTFEDPTGFARIDGQPALALEVKKRSGANIIDTVAATKAVMDELAIDWPETVDVTYLQDQSNRCEPAVRSGSQRHRRRGPGDDRDRLRTGIAVGDPGGVGHSGGVPGGRHRVAGDRGDHEHRGPVQLDPGGRHVGGRGHRDDRVGGPPFAGRGRPARRLCVRGQAHGLAHHRIHRHHVVGVLSAAVLDRHGGRVHEVPAHHGDPDAVRILVHGADLHPRGWRFDRQATTADRSGQACHARSRTRRPARYRRADGGVCPRVGMGHSAARRDADAGGRPAAGGVLAVRSVRAGRDVLPVGRA